MKLAMRLCSSSHPIASICLVNGGPRTSFASIYSSECGFCRTVLRIKVSSSRTSSTLVIAPSISSPQIPGFAITASTNPTRSDAPQRSEEWFALRRDKLTTSTFGTALGFWKGNRRPELWSEKVFSPDPNDNDSDYRNLNPGKYSAMDWGVSNEALAIGRYEGITGREVELLGFAVHAEERLGWLGASPDGILSCFELGDGILEVKCPYNKGKPEKGLPWSKVPFYYVPQVQGQMEVMDREWLDLYCWTPNGSSVFRVNRDRAYWDLIHGLLREFWWDHVVPAREAFALGRDEKDIRSLYQPASTHKLTGLVIFKSTELAEKAKLFCREIAGHVEYF